MARTYAEAGVDIDASDHATAALVAQLGSATRKGDGAPITLENGFAGLVQLECTVPDAESPPGDRNF